MDEERVLLFIERIIRNTEAAQAEMVLSQLADVLESDGVPSSLVRLVRDSRESHPELAELCRNQEAFTAEQVRKANDRARVRKEREAMRLQYGRC